MTGIKILGAAAILAPERLCLYPATRFRGEDGRMHICQ